MGEFEARVFDRELDEIYNRNAILQKAYRVRTAEAGMGFGGQSQKTLMRVIMASMFSANARRNGVLDAGMHLINEYEMQAYNSISGQWLEDRLTGTLERLRSKGYCCEKSFPEASAKMFSIGATGLSMITAAIMNNCPVEEIDKVMCDDADEMWGFAIEYVMAKHGLNIMCDESNRRMTTQCVNNIAEIYEIALLYAPIIALLKRVKAYDAIKELQDSTTALYKKAVKQKREIDRDAESVEQLKNSCATSVSRINAENEALRTQIQKLQRRNAALEKIIEAEETNPGLDDDNAVSSEAESLTENDNSQESAAEDPYAGIEDVVLPEDKTVIFLGGHRNFVKKMRSVHPNWRYISDEEATCADIAQISTSKISFVVFFSGHTSHSTSLRVLDNISADVPIVYLDTVNMTLADKKIKEAYKDAFASKIN